MKREKLSRAQSGTLQLVPQKQLRTIPWWSWCGLLLVAGRLVIPEALAAHVWAKQELTFTAVPR